MPITPIRRFSILSAVVCASWCVLLECARAELKVKPAAAVDTLDNARRPRNDKELRRWLENMVWHHRLTTAEIVSATGLSPQEIGAAKRRFNIFETNRPDRPADAPIQVLPYPGGRHPRIGFQEGAARPQRDTKVSVFAPWDPAAYVVIDAPEGIRVHGKQISGLIYLAHTHTETVWQQQGIQLEQREWEIRDDGSLRTERLLPNGIHFATTIVPKRRSVAMEFSVTNGTSAVLDKVQVKHCMMLKGAAEFAQQTDDNKLVSKPYVACRSSEANRWVITAWDRCAKARVKSACPCMHSDPTLVNLAPGETQRIRGWLSFYEGSDIETELYRIETTGWRDK